MFTCVYQQVSVTDVARLHGCHIHSSKKFVLQCFDAVGWAAGTAWHIKVIPQQFTEVFFWGLSKRGVT